MSPSVPHPTEYRFSATINGIEIQRVRIGLHYLLRHAGDVNDELILELVASLDGLTFPVDSIGTGDKQIEYFAADIAHTGRDRRRRIYRLIWIFEGNKMEVLGVVNAYRRKKAARWRMK